MKLIDTQRLSLNPNCRISRVNLIPGMPYDCIVVDDLYQDPSYVRELALSLHYGNTRGRYPGFEARINLDIQYLVDFMSKAMGKPLASHPMGAHSFVFSCMCEQATPRSRHYPHPHIDALREGAALYAGVVYLNTPEACSGGTGFYRHRASGIFEFPSRPDDSVQEYMKSQGLSSLPGLQQQLLALSDEDIEKINTDEKPWGLIAESNALWEQVSMINMRFNRLVLYSAYYYHNPIMHEGDFGTTTETKRLTQNFLLEQISTT